jgi:type III restriction enzyme
MSEDELSLMETAIPVYAKKIQNKIDSLEEVYREEQFKKWVDSGKIVCKDSYTPAEVITPANTTDSIPYSLYEAEKDDMNKFERQVIDAVVGTDNVHWWHRIIERKDFRVNGYFNHYPDFMVKTKSGKLVLIEAKGDYLDGDDSKKKLILGRKWQELAGRMYRYFMVFKKKEFEVEGSYPLDKFVDIIKNMQ